MFRGDKPNVHSSIVELIAVVKLHIEFIYAKIPAFLQVLYITLDLKLKAFYVIAN